MTTKQAHILIVDDEELNLEILTEYLSEYDYKISTAADGQIAWNLLEQSPNEYNVILLDRMMPNMSGMDLLEKINLHPILKHCTVIFQTAKASASDIAEGLMAGAYYYLTKPFEEETLLSVTKTAVHDHFNFKEIQNNLSGTKLSMGLLESACFQFKTLEEARSIASLISNTCPAPKKVVMGLTELLINAIEHGNLGISYTEKTELNHNGDWVDEVNTRLQLPENINKQASISYQRHPDYIEIIIIDEGEGFNWNPYLDFDPDRVMDNHGRGIAIANKISFSSIDYKGKGNKVITRLVLK